MSGSLNLNLILAVAIVVAALAGFGWLIWRKVAALGLTRDDFDRRAPWLALGVIIGGVLLYYMKH